MGRISPLTSAKDTELQSKRAQFFRFFYIKASYLAINMESTAFTGVSSFSIYLPHLKNDTEMSAEICGSHIICRSALTNFRKVELTKVLGSELRPILKQFFSCEGEGRQFQYL